MYDMRSRSWLRPSMYFRHHGPCGSREASIQRDDCEILVEGWNPEIPWRIPTKGRPGLSCWVPCLDKLWASLKSLAPPKRKS